MSIHYDTGFLARAIRWHRPLMFFALASAMLAVGSAIGMVIDDRLIAGSTAWFKPFKFAVSFALYSVAWAWMISLRPKGSRALWWAGTVAVAAGGIELVIIVWQVARGTRSHFNTNTAFDTALWYSMTATIVVLFLGTLVAAGMLAFQRLGDAPNTWSIRLGMLISLVGMALGQLMASNPSGVEKITGAHTVGAPDGTTGMALTGWSTTNGDLRIPHFVGMHALQLLPLLAAALPLLAAKIPLLRSEKLRLDLVWVAAAGYSGILTVLTWQALRGQPLIRPDNATVVALAAVVGATTIGVVGAALLALRSDRPQMAAAR
ncbi:hypothetical protein [Nocardia gipuzkoensis]